ncbi:P-loop NTPase family protein [Gemella bergeri]
MIIGTSLLSNRKVIVLDEPTSGLDYRSMIIMSDLITKKAEEVPFIIITHDLELLFKTCHSVLMINKDSYKKISVKGNENIIFDFINKE